MTWLEFSKFRTLLIMSCQKSFIKPPVTCPCCIHIQCLTFQTKRMPRNEVAIWKEGNCSHLGILCTKWAVTVTKPSDIQSAQRNCTHKKNLEDHHNRLKHRKPKKKKVWKHLFQTTDSLIRELIIHTAKHQFHWEWCQILKQPHTA